MLDKINKQLLPLKGHFFLWNAGTGPVVSFLSTYARQLGFSSVIVGVIYTVLPVCGMIVKPAVGAVADKFLCQKKIFLFAQLLTAAAFLSVFYSPKIDNASARVFFSCDYSEIAFNSVNRTTNEALFNKLQSDESVVDCKMDCLSSSVYWNMICKDENDSIHCNNTKDAKYLTFNAFVPKSSAVIFGNSVIFRIANVSMNGGPAYYPKCTDHVTSVCTVDCKDYTMNEILFETRDSTDDEVYASYQFWVFLVLMIISWSGQAVVVSVGDAICFGMLGDKPEKFGHQRLWGSLGWGISSSIAGFVIDAMSEGQSEKNYTAIFYGSSAILVLDFIASARIKHTQIKTSPGILRDITVLLKDVRICVFLLWCMVTGMCTGIIWNFLFWLVEDLADLQGPSVSNNVKTLQGIMMAIQCLLGELPFFFLSGWILKRIGHVHTMSLVLLAIGCRFILYSVIPNPWWFLPVEFSNGLTFGLCYACMASYASIVAPPGTDTTIQGLVGAIFEGVGVSLGSLITGFLYEDYGGPKTFRIFGIAVLIASLLHAGVQYIIAKKDFQVTYMHPNGNLRRKVDEEQEKFTFVVGT